LARRFGSIEHSGTFNRIYQNARNWHTPGVICFYMKNGPEIQAGFTASKKVGNAVERNRAKRRMTAIFQELQDQLKPGHYVLVAKRAIHGRSYPELKNDIAQGLKRLGGL